MKLYNQGYSDREIAKILGVGHNTTWERRIKLRLPSNKPKYFSNAKLSYLNMNENRKINTAKWAKRNPEKYNRIHYEQIRNYQITNKEKLNKMMQLKYREKHPVVLRATWHPKTFTDQQFMELYNQGLNDRQIAKILGVGKSSTQVRRNQLKLPPNYQQYTRRKIDRER